MQLTNIVTIPCEYFPVAQAIAMLRREVSIALKTNEWNSLKVQFRELVRDESLRGELEKFFDDEIRRRFGMAISGAVEAAEIEESRSR